MNCKVFTVMVLSAFLVACGDPRTTTGVVIDIQEWTCSKTALVEFNEVRMIGRIPVKEVENRQVCVQWSRMGY